MSKVDRQALRELAEKAGAQEWGQDKGDVVALGGWPGSSGPLVLASANENFPEHALNTAAYVAAANPATVLALLDEIEALHRDRKTMRNVLYELIELDESGRLCATRPSAWKRAAAKARVILGLEVRNGR